MATRKASAPARKLGRPSKYRPEFVETTRKLCLNGATAEDVAYALGVAKSTIYEWCAEFPDFSDALTRAREIADAEVVNSLYRRANGYIHDEVDIRTVTLPNGGGSEIVMTPILKIYPPDPTSMIFWLKNRQPEKWRDKREDERGSEEAAALLAELIDKLPP